MQVVYGLVLESDAVFKQNSIVKIRLSNTIHAISDNITRKIYVGVEGETKDLYITSQRVKIISPKENPEYFL
jgi:hypothetical protein